VQKVPSRLSQSRGNASPPRGPLPRCLVGAKNRTEIIKRDIISASLKKMLSQAVFQQRQQILLSPACGRATLMNGFELILPFLRPIQHLILDPEISEIMVNGPERIFVEKAGYLQSVPGVKLTHGALIVAVKNIARRLGDDISEAKPILDSRLPDGSRVAAVIPPCSIHGVALTIRKFNSHRFKMKDLIEVGTVTTALAAQLEGYVAQRKNILICGGTSSGKTTLANLLTEFIPDHERIVLIEDTAEIQIQKDNVLRFEARREQNGLPAVTIRDLLKATLRHRPDRIILGEIRGGEAFDLLQLLNTGHSGTISTVHANSAAQGISRFTTCVLQSGVEIPYLAIKANIAESLDVIVHIERRPGQRLVAAVLALRGFDPENDKYSFDFVYQHHIEGRHGLQRNE
jgi:pilus assembly protein CpaF